MNKTVLNKMKMCCMMRMCVPIYYCRKRKI